MTPEEVSAFMDEVTGDMISSATEQVRAMVFADDHLRGALVAFQEAASGGLLDVAEGRLTAVTLESALRVRKSTTVSAATLHVDEVEGLLGRALSAIVGKAREVEAGRGGVG